MKKLTLLTAILMTANMVFTQVINIPADYPTIQQGVDAAGDGDTVLVHPGTYYENVYLPDKSLTLASLFLTTHDTSYVSQTVIDAEGSGSVLSSIYNFSNVRISGMTITGGGSSSIWFLSEPNNVMIDHVIITGNSGDGYGAGVTIWGGTDIQFRNVTISNNSDGYYGGGVCCLNSSPIFENCFFTDNNGYYGGAVYCWESNPVFRNVVFTGNNMNNYFTYGSVLYMSSGNNPCFPALINCTMTGNYVWLENGYSGIIDCVHPCSSNVTVINSVSWHNGVWVNKYGADYLNHSTISYTNVGGYVAPGEGNISVEPLFHGTGAHPYQLSPGSPCIDAGTPDTTGLSLPLMDLLGNYRIWDGDGDGI
ncbi:MAG: right-handed parallel beta-helix repeat-containing protein, partial [Bacteroidetes bacterium]|nr:right-handed parallel beta-helix repeat-containing protein [Bacteroidota bacterium]